jgi:ATP/ADP translocase
VHLATKNKRSLFVNWTRPRTLRELPALGWCWLYISSVLASYYILRPIRDQMGVAGGVNNLQWLFTGTLVVMIVLNIPFSALVKMLPRRQFIPLTYRFFAVTILAFGAALHFATPEETVWIGRFFFIWTSVFNLFVVSIFWAMVVDIFTSEQGKRLFGFIAAGATIGAIVGSAVTASLATTVSQPVLPHPDRHSAKILNPIAGTGAERDQTDDKKSRRHGRDVEGQNLDDQGRPDIRPKHDRQCRHQTDHALGGE